MKKIISTLIISLFIFSLAGCGSSNEAPVSAYYSSPEEVTLEKIAEMSSPAKMVEYKGGVELKFVYKGTGDENLDNGETTIKYKKDGEIIHSNQLADYPDNQFTHLYFSTDKNDPTLYMTSNAGKDNSAISSEEIDSIMNEQLYNFNYMDAELISVTEQNGNYIAKVELSYNGVKDSDIDITIDPVSGYVLESLSTYTNEGNGLGNGTQQVTITYSSDIAIDMSPKTDTPTNAEISDNNTGKFSFSSVDIDGNPVTDEIIRNAKVVMVNYWEPWCGPCVGEMPDLEKLYEEYKEQGLLVLGVFSSTDMDDDARAILKDCNITYPVVRADDSLRQFMTDYFPTTIFTDSEGNVLSDEPVIGANSYANWKEIIESYLN